MDTGDRVVTPDEVAALFRSIKEGAAMDTEDRLLTPAEVAAVFRVDPKTVTRWASAGRIGRVRTPGGHSRYRESEVRALLQEGGPDADVQNLIPRPLRSGARAGVPAPVVSRSEAAN